MQMLAVQSMLLCVRGKTPAKGSVRGQRDFSRDELGSWMKEVVAFDLALKGGQNFKRQREGVSSKGPYKSLGRGKCTCSREE